MDVNLALDLKERIQRNVGFSCLHRGNNLLAKVRLREEPIISE